MRFSTDYIDKVRDANDLVELVSQHVQLTRSGSSWRGLCPFPGHAEKTPSFFVSDVKQVYHCFGCQKGGTAYNFLMEIKGMTFPEAVEYLADKANIPLPPKTNNQSGQAISRPQGDGKLLHKLNHYVAAHYERTLNALSENHPVRQYVQKRGLSSELVQEFQIGYSSSGWHDLVEVLERAKAPLSAAESLGLLKKNKQGNYFDLFRDRLMFPIIAANGNVVGFGGRSLTDEQQPKYLNSPESPVFYKGRTLFGLNVTAKYIRSQDEAYVVEGYMDALALYQNGIKNVVATLGTAVTLQHAKLLKRLCKKVVALFDGDDAGMSASDKSLPIFLEAGLTSKCLILEDKMDPDDYLKAKGVESFLNLSKEAPDHFVSYLNRITKSYRGQPSEKAEILNKLLPILEKVGEARLRLFYAQEVGDRLGLEANWVARQVKVKSAQPIVNTDKNQQTSAEPPPKEELILIERMLSKKEYLDFVRDSEIVPMFHHPQTKALGLSILEKYCQNPNDFDKLTAYLSTGEGPLNWLTSHIALSEGKAPLDKSGEKQLIQDCLNRVKSRHLKAESKKMLQTLKSDPNLESLKTFMEIAREQKNQQGV